MFRVLVFRVFSYPRILSPESPVADPGLNGFIANAPGSHESTMAGDPQRVSPMRAWRRAMSVEICSGEGNGRASSENWTMRPGVGSTATVTRSAAGGGFDSRSSKASVRAYARRELQPAIATIARAPHASCHLF